ncbi:MAG: iron-containing redox enzyme family protein [Gammaproteobacteria bacterium]|nr:iron-containing redox enzyme family protein [Gammaproteobacteria bacterium]
MPSTDTLLDEKTFWKALRDARQSVASIRHPFSEAWAAGKLSREQLGEWAVQHHYYIAPVPQHLALLYSRIPDLDARQHVMENIVGEEMPEAPEKRHPNLLVKFAIACGKSREDVEGAEERGDILPSTRAMAAWTWELTAIRSISDACASLMVGLEGQLPTLYPTYVSAMEKMGFTDDDLEFFHVHIEGDVGHAQTGLELTSRYANTPQLQRRAIALVKATAEMRYKMLDGIYEAIFNKRAAA